MSEEQEVRWCSRCHCSVPLLEWKVSAYSEPRLYIKHVGPMRDHDPDVYVEADENGNVDCGFVEHVVTERV